MRKARGIGDILMSRMIFADFKRTMPDIELHFACFRQYYELLKDIPEIKLVDADGLNRFDYLISYDISECCWRYECKVAPHTDKHRAEIWTDHCGVKLTQHDMRLPFIPDDLIQWGRFQVRQRKGMSRKLLDGGSPIVMFSPIAFDPVRSLMEHQIEGAVEHLRKMNCFIYMAHPTTLPEMENTLGVTVFSGMSTQQWLALIHAADYVVTVDTSTFHYAGGIGKPMTGIFTHVDGKYRGKFYDFILVQKHRDNGDWPCGPCYNFSQCTNSKCESKDGRSPLPCLTELTVGEITAGLDKMFERWPVKKAIKS